jgi:beta-glucosidase-like glycosyl hydrolase
MEMKGVTKYFPNGEADLHAFLAGNDLIELSENSKNAEKLIRKAVRKGKISKEEFEAKVKKMLAAKYWAGLSNYKEISPANLVQDLNRPAAAELIQQLSDAAVTMIKGDSRVLRQDPMKRTAIISIGVTGQTTFQRELFKWYPNSNLFVVGKNTPVSELNNILAALKQYDQVFVGIHDTRLRPASKLDYSSDVKLLIADLAARPNSVISVFANPYSIAGLPGIEKSGALLACYQKDDALQRSAVKVITGQQKPIGKLPVSINMYFTTGMSVAL